MVEGEAKGVVRKNYICISSFLPLRVHFFSNNDFLCAMKFLNNVLKIILTLLITVTLITSCSKEDPGKGYTYLVSKDLALPLTTVYINNIIDGAASEYSELSALKDYVKSDVDVYKIVYRTTVKGEKINASGLVCVPTQSGEYPVLCFQNGTNTVNAYAPSEFPINGLYQMIEIVASMGYVVVIPDYPGFGSSKQVAHPYLVSEPTVRSIIDMLYAANEMDEGELPDIQIKNEYYLIGYSQGGWATLALHKAMELDYSDDFNLKGSACGAGPYDLSLLFRNMINANSYPMPVYIGYIINAYKAYNQFSNPVSDILKGDYASRLGSLYTGNLSSDQINSQLTTSIPDLITADFLTGFESSAKYAEIRQALNLNSIASWNSSKPLLLIHGGGDTQVNPVTTHEMYNAMIQAGTSSGICIKEILPGLDHGEGIVPCMIRGLIFLRDLQDN